MKNNNENMTDEERMNENTLRVFELVGKYMQGALPPDEQDDGESIPLVKAWGNWRAGE